MSNRYVGGVGPSGGYFALDTHQGGKLRYTHGPYSSDEQASVVAKILNGRLDARAGIAEILETYPADQPNRFLYRRINGGYAIGSYGVAHYVFGSEFGARRKWESFNE